MIVSTCNSIYWCRFLYAKYLFQNSYILDGLVSQDLYRINQEWFYRKFHHCKTESMHESAHAFFQGFQAPCTCWQMIFYIWSSCSHSMLGCLCPQPLALTAQDLSSLLSLIASCLRAVKINELQYKMVKLIIHQFAKDHSCISILCGALQLACWGTGVLSGVEVTSTEVCVCAQERGSRGACQRWLGWLYGWGGGQRFGCFMTLETSGMTRRKVYVEGMTTAVFHQSKIL